MSGPYVIQFSPSGQYWIEPAAGQRCGSWCAHRNDATRYPRRADVDAAAASLRAKFQRHNRAGIHILPLVPVPQSLFDPMRRHHAGADLTLPLNFEGGSA